MGSRNGGYVQQYTPISFKIYLCRSKLHLYSQCYRKLRNWHVKINSLSHWQSSYNILNMDSHYLLKYIKIKSCTGILFNGIYYWLTDTVPSDKCNLIMAPWTKLCPPLCSTHLCWQPKVSIWWLHMMASFEYDSLSMSRSSSINQDPSLSR